MNVKNECSMNEPTLPGLVVLAQDVTPRSRRMKPYKIKTTQALDDLITAERAINSEPSTHPSITLPTLKTCHKAYK